MPAAVLLVSLQQKARHRHVTQQSGYDMIWAELIRFFLAAFLLKIFTQQDDFCY